MSLFMPPDARVAGDSIAMARLAASSGSSLVGHGASTVKTRLDLLSNSSLTSILEYIPEVEWSGIFDGTTNYDCSSDIQRAFDENPAIEFPTGTFIINETVRHSVSGKGLTIIGANQVETIFKAGPALAAARDPMFWFGNNCGHGVNRLHFNRFRIEGGDPALYAGATSGAGYQGCIGIRLQECGYCYVGNFWIRGCYTAIENIGSIGLQLGGEWSMIFYCREGIRDSESQGANSHGLSSLDPDDTSRTLSPLTLNTNVCRYQNIVLSAVGRAIRVKGGLTRLDRVTLQSCGFTTSDDLIHLLDANESYDYGEGPTISDLWNEGGKYRSVIRIENTRGATVRDSFISLSGANNEQGIIIKGSHGATIQGVKFRGTPSATPTESRTSNHAYYVHSDSKSGFFGPNYFAINQITPKIEWSAYTDNHVVVDNHRSNNSSRGLTVGAVQLDGSRIAQNPDLPVATAYNIQGVASYKDRNNDDVVGTRKTGWALDTGTAKRTTNATYSGTASSTYSQAEMQEVMDALRDATQTIKALKDDLDAVAGHGLIGA